MRITYLLLLSLLIFSCVTEPEENTSNITIYDNWFISNINKHDIIDGVLSNEINLPLPMFSTFSIIDDVIDSTYLIPFELRYTYNITDEFLITNYIIEIYGIDSLMLACSMFPPASWDIENNECIISSSKLYSFDKSTSDTLCLATNCSNFDNCFEYVLIDNNMLELKQILSNGYCYNYDEPNSSSVGDALNIPDLVGILQQCKNNYNEQDCLENNNNANQWETIPYSLIITLNRE